MKTIGYIGLGIMGMPMALNLTKKGAGIVKGFDVFDKQRELYEAKGGTAAGSLSELIGESDILFLCLPTNELVEETICTIMKEGKPGAIIIDNSSTAPGIIRRLYPQVKKAGKFLLDAPVSGGQTGAEAGTLVIMCGGDEEKFLEAEPLFEKISSKATYMGGPGCGSVTKLINNMMVGVHLGVLGEAFAFGAKAGINTDTLFAAIKDGFAQSAVMDIKGPKLIAGDYTATARVAVHQKDLKNAVQLAHELGVEIPLSQIMLEQMNQLETQGEINLDHCAVARIYEKAMQVSISDAAQKQ